MKYTFILLLILPFLAMGQNEKNYLAGAVSEVDGKVIFSKEIKIPGLSAGEIYDLMYEWANERFPEGKNRVAYSDKQEGNIVALGEEYLVFSSHTFSLDRSLISYRLTIETKNQVCKLSTSGIRYEYNVSYQKEPERYIAEEWITDKHALAKNGKLNRMSGKFRRGTIDYMDKLFDEAVGFLSTKISGLQQPEPVSPVSVTGTNSVQITPATPVAAFGTAQQVENNTGTLDGYRKISPDKIPGNIIKMLSEDWMLITAGNGDEFNMMTASWGGLGVLFGKPMAFCFINPARYTHQLMEKNDTYTFTFYTEAYRDVLQYCGSASGRDKDKVKESGLTPITTPAGSKAFAEAWMIIECRKVISQPFTTDVINDADLKKEWTGKQINDMYIGEIINVWIK